MKKKLASMLITSMLITSTVSTVQGATFDATWYAAKYPDVVAQYGNDPAVLQYHYNNIGQFEGRFPSAIDEQVALQKLADEIIKTQNLLALQQAASQNPTTVSPTVSATSISQAAQSNSLMVFDSTIIPSFSYGTYVDVDITNQRVTFFKDEKSVFYVPCVTGNPNKGHSTPLGIYKIKAHVNGKRLKGKTWDVWVNKWMRFTDSAVGLHDASWRKSFGGTIYQKNGSHGCVNLPSDAASYLFDQVSVGTYVIVHN